TRPVTSATSNPAGSAVRVRPTFAGSITELTAEGAAAAPEVDGGGAGSDSPQAAHSVSTRATAKMRTPP
ncbi:MAG: hypothetical protein K0R01_3477, partial [Mycobacterium sp.]|nr:hypothetical protein [Mycobacterium sp.]